MQNLIHAFTPAVLPLEEATRSLGGTQGPDLTAYFQVCGLLLVVIIAVALGMRKLVSGNLKLRASQRSLQVIDILNMGGRRKLAVVRCYDRTFVLGMGEKEISPIAELDPVIGTDQPATQASKADDEAFAQALEKIQESMPEAELMTKLLEAQDRVSPSLAKKMKRAEASPAPAAPAAQPAAPVERQPVAQAQQSPVISATAGVPKQAKPKVQKKRVRRKVAKKAVASDSPRRLEAQAVASAALDKAAAKRHASTSVSGSQTRSSTVKAAANVETPVNQPVQVEPPILRMEGIVG
jgi:flagellar biogenesis protein FliO